MTVLKYLKPDIFKQNIEIFIEKLEKLNLFINLNSEIIYFLSQALLLGQNEEIIFDNIKKELIILCITEDMRLSGSTGIKEITYNYYITKLFEIYKEIYTWSEIQQLSETHILKQILKINTKFISIPALFAQEEYFYTWINNIELRQQQKFEFNEEIFNTPLLLNNEQKIAVYKAVNHKIMLITGGPGTGKTTVIISILRALFDISDKNNLNYSLEDIALVAPTGKAANRMTESIKKQIMNLNLNSDNIFKDNLDKIKAQTLHRFLGYNPSYNKFKYHETNQVNKKFILIDETSMIDLVLFNNFLKAVPEFCALVFVGDTEQLPSVEVGAVLRDLNIIISDNNKVELLINNRVQKDNENKLLNLIINIKNNNFEKIFNILNYCKHVYDIKWKDTEIFNYQTNEMIDFLNIWTDRYVNNNKIILQELENKIFNLDNIDTINVLNLIQNQIILSVTRIGQTGSINLSKIIHYNYAKLFVNNFNEHHFSCGEPVIVCNNDYLREIFNGDIGICVKVKDHQKIVLGVYFYGDKPKLYLLRDIQNNLEYAWSITTHKSQGSEYNHVSFILPEQADNFLSKELIYTAITRAKQSILVIGNSDILLKGLQNQIVRQTNILLSNLKEFI